MKIAKTKKDFERLLKEKHFRVTIFGSARIKKEDPRYKQIKTLAKMIGEQGIDIITGGGPGIMAAANSGHVLGRKKSKITTHSIGLGIKLPHEQAFNQSVGIKKSFNRFSNRLDNFMLLSNVVVVAPGGVGTLLELFYTWQLMQVKHICNVPIILLGDMWDDLLKWLEKDPLRKKFFDKKDFDLLIHAKNSSEAIKIINHAHTEYLKGNPKHCLNYKKYQIH
tara:strand:- start:3358 stop:4023 length:666 start_codon:yes stop_codon:yes gene_type:complete